MSKTFIPQIFVFPAVNPMPTELILASGSRYRRDLLTRLHVPFRVQSSEVNETRRAGEAPPQLVTRLARAKATAVAAQFPDDWVIGADQVAVSGGRVVGKPGGVAQSIAQLKAASGQTVTVLTAVCLMQRRDAKSEQHLDETRVHFRSLGEAEIERYVALEQPFDCAGGFKSEGLGIALLDRIDAVDPTALIGLPLIWLSGALRRAGIEV